MKKRLIALILSFAMVISMMPASVFAENVQETENMLETSYLVCFEANGDDVEGLPEIQIVKGGELAAVPASPIREGYFFLGWYENPDETRYENVFDFANTPITGNITLYAVWGDPQADDDQDGLPNSVEEQLGTDPKNEDTDGDGLSDYLEIVYVSTDPLKADTDGDVVSDYDEDYDGDGIANGLEVQLGSKPGSADSDYDGLNDGEEMDIGSDPLCEDTDGDGVADGLEVQYGYDPLTADASFTDKASSQPISKHFPVSAAVCAEVSAEQLGSVALNPLTQMDNPLISKNIPGYLGNAFALTADGEITDATLTFQYDTDTWQLGQSFQPRVYGYDEETQELWELPEQNVTEKEVTAIIDGCGTYILLNKCEYDVVKGNSEITLFGAANISEGTYVAYYAAYEEDLRALAANGDTTDANEDGIPDKYNMYIYLGLIPTVAGAPTFVGYDFSRSADLDGDNVLNGNEIKIEIHNGLPKIKVLSYPMLKDSDFDGWDDAEELDSSRKTDPLRQSYKKSYVESLLNDDLYAAALLVKQIESNWSKQGALDLLTLLGYVEYGSLENTYTREWLSYLVNYYDNRTGEILEDSAQKYQREYWIGSGMVILETAAKCVVDELDDLTVDIIAEAIQDTNTEVIKNATAELTELITLRDTTSMRYFHALGESWDIDGGECAKQIDSMAKTIGDCNAEITSLEVEIKHKETVNKTVDTVTTTIDIMGLIKDEAEDLKDVCELISQISANFEAYASSREIFYFIYQHHPEEKARNAAWVLCETLASQEKLLSYEYLQVCESFGQVGVGIIVVALENVLDLNPFASMITEVVKGTVTSLANMNNIIIADDILCDAMKALTLKNLVVVGNSYSPRSQVEKVLTDRYLANLIQLRILGEMRMNSYIRTEDSQTRHDSNVEKLKGYAESFNIPLSAALLIQCTLTTTPNVVIDSVHEYLDSRMIPPSGDHFGIYYMNVPKYYKVTIDGFIVNDVSGINLTPGDHVVEIYTQNTKPCSVYITVAEDGTIAGSDVYTLNVDLVHDLANDNIVTGYIRNATFGGTMSEVTITIREGINNKTGTPMKSFDGTEGGFYATVLPNGYYTFAFSKSGYATEYACISLYEDATIDANLFLGTDGQITYVAPDANNVPAPQENLNGETTLSSVVPVKEGYLFAGWSETEGDRTTLYAPGAQLPAEKDGNVTLYAVWDAGVFDIVFHANGGIFENAGTDTITRQKTYLEPFLIDVEVPKKDGCTFAGVWALDNGTTTYQHGITHSDIGSAGLSTKHLYAVWKTTEANVLYDYGDDPTGANVTLVKENVDLSAGNVTCTIKDAEAVQTYNGNSFKGWICQDPSGALWWANAWADNGPYTLYKPGNQIPLNGDVVLYAKWTYFLHYDHANGQFMHTEVGDSGTHTVVQPVYENEEKIFQYWTYVTADGETGTCAPGDLINVTSDVYLTAVWADAAYGVSGTVTDGTAGSENYGNPIEGVIVAFYDESGACAGATMTDAAGVYKLNLPASGIYSRTFIKGGYTTVTVDALHVGETTAPAESVTMVVGSTPPVIASGMCGDKIVWMMDDEGLLDIIGAGAMPDYGITVGGPWVQFKNSISKINVRDSITTIGDNAFTGMSGYLTSVSLSKDLVSIGESAFYQVRYLTKVDLPETLEWIKRDAFSDSGLQQITIPKNVKEIGYYVEGYGYFLSNPFESCTSLTEIQVDPYNLSFRAENGLLYTKDMTTLIACPEGKRDELITIPEGVEQVVSTAFGSLNYSDQFKGVTIPSTLNDLSAFDMGVSFERFEVAAAHPTYCSVDGVIFSKDQKTLKLYPSANPATRYRVPDEVEEIDGGTFVYCNNLIALELPDSLTKLDDNAIQLCPLLCNLVIPENVTYLGRHALSQCNSLADVYFMGNVPTTFHKEAIYHLDYYNVALTLHYVEGTEGWSTPTCTINGRTYNTKTFEPSSLDLSIAASGTCNESIRWEVSTDGVLTISGTGEMPSYASGSTPWDKYQSVIQKVVVKSGITAIGDYAFVYCDKLTTAELPDSLLTIGSNAFSSCAGLTDITLPNKLQTIGSRAFSGCSGLTDIVIPDSVQSVGAEAFYHCTGLVKIQLQDGLKVIADGMFNSCERLKTVKLPDTLTAIGSEAFRGCDGLTSISIPDGVEAIGEKAFYFCEKLASVQLPDSLQTLGSGTFTYCSSLSSMVIPDGVSAIENQTFQSCSGLKSVVLPEGLETIGESAFSSCNSLKEIALPDSVTTIGKRAFFGCASITEITLPEGVEAISEGMLYTCEKLERVVIPSTVNSIGRTAFYGCSSLTGLYFKGNVPEMWMFDGLWSVCDNVTIYFVEGTTGWTTPTWTSPNRDTFKTETWSGGGVRPIKNATVSSGNTVVCTVDETVNQFTEMIVGAYSTENGQFLGAAMGNYDGSTNTITVSFAMELPDAVELRVFCTDDDFVPQYKVSSFSQAN